MSENAVGGKLQDHELHRPSVAELVELWQSTRLRTLVAEYRRGGEPDPADWWTELSTGARLAREVTVGRWCVVARLLRRGVVEDWRQIGNAMDMTETEARDGFVGWIAGQVMVRRHGGTIGLTDSEADELYRLAESVPL
jgi:hypothetical protein